jgi:hypothetical protein
MNSSDAEALSLLMLQLNARMNDSVWFVKEKGDPQEFDAYRRQAGEVMGALLEVVESIYVKHPHLRPKELGGEYVVDPNVFANRFYEPPDPNSA